MYGIKTIILPKIFKRDFFEKLKNISISDLKDYAEKEDDKILKSNILSLNSRVKNIEILSDKKINDFKLEHAIINSEIFFKFPNNISINNAWYKNESTMLIGPNKDLLFFIKPPSYSVVMLLRGLIQLLFSVDLKLANTPIFGQKKLNNILEVLEERVGDHFQAFELYRAIFEQVTKGKFKYTELNIKTSHLEDTSEFQTSFKNSKRWKAASFKIIFDKKNFLSFRVDRYGNIIMYTNEQKPSQIEEIINIVDLSVSGEG